MDNELNVEQIEPSVCWAAFKSLCIENNAIHILHKAETMIANIGSAKTFELLKGTDSFKKLPLDVIKITKRGMDYFESVVNK